VEDAGDVKMNLADIRREYEQGALHRDNLEPDPIRQFERWMDDALRAEILEPTAMTLATTSADGDPAARIVLLKRFDEEGFVFFTNYRSQKGRHIADNPRVELAFWWDKLQRTVRIHGTAEKISVAESQEYFHLRPRRSQIGALASDQSEIVENRRALEQRFAELEQQHEGQPIPMPEHWGGYIVRPQTIEFWQGRTSRLHDRFRYERQPDNTWLIQRLQP
jgi:pyridoxamine 5'-phosphate oxidase